jgi:hypothetical protein
MIRADTWVLPRACMNLEEGAGSAKAGQGVKTGAGGGALGTAMN